MTPHLSWSDRWSDWRVRLLRSTRFVELASKLPLIRLIARRRAKRLFDLCAGFVYSQVLLACVRLDLFETLAERPMTVEQVSAHTSLPPESARILLRAAASLGLLEKRSGERFGLGPMGAALLANPGIAAMIDHHALFYADLSDPIALLRGEHETALRSYWSYVDSQTVLRDDEVAGYSRLMARSHSLVAQQILDAYPIGRHRCLLDVGGGEGGFLVEAGGRAPHLRLMLFDLPAVAKRAETRLADAGLAGRASTFGGEFFVDPLPKGADVVSLVRVVHDHDDEQALALLRAVHAALPAGGVLLLGEPMAGTAGAESVGDAYFGLYLLAMGSGRPRRADELEDLLRRAGFSRWRRLPTAMPLQTSLIAAER